MPELRYTFAELLKILFEIHKAPGMTQADLATKIQVSTPTINGWFNGRYKPRHRADAERLVEALGLEPIEADLLLYSIKHDWVKYGTSVHDLLQHNIVQSLTKEHPQNPMSTSEHIPEQVSYDKERQKSQQSFFEKHALRIFITLGCLVGILFILINNTDRPEKNPAMIDNIRLLSTKDATPIQITDPISPTEIESSWTRIVDDPFNDNRFYWGLGTRTDNNGELVKTIINGTYQITLTTAITAGVYMGGDSPHFAPTTYYLSVDVKKLKGQENDGCGFLFDEVSDALHSMFRTRDELKIISVTSVIDGGNWTIHINRTNAPSLKPRETNKLAILANGDDFRFFVNDVLVGSTNMPRVANSRIDVGIMAGQDKTTVVCEFDNFRVFVPSAK